MLNLFFEAELFFSLCFLYRFVQCWMVIFWRKIQIYYILYYIFKVLLWHLYIGRKKEELYSFFHQLEKNKKDENTKEWNSSNGLSSRTNTHLHPAVSLPGLFHLPFWSCTSITSFPSPNRDGRSTLHEGDDRSAPRWRPWTGGNTYSYTLVQKLKEKKWTIYCLY